MRIKLPFRVEITVRRRGADEHRYGVSYKIDYSTLGPKRPEDQP